MAGQEVASIQFPHLLHREEKGPEPGVQPVPEVGHLREDDLVSISAGGHIGMKRL